MPEPEITELVPRFMPLFYTITSSMVIAGLSTIIYSQDFFLQILFAPSLFGIAMSSIVVLPFVYVILFTIDYSTYRSNICGAVILLLALVPPYCMKIISWCMWHLGIFEEQLGGFFFFTLWFLMMLYIGFGVNGYIVASVNYRLFKKHKSQDLKYSKLFISVCALLSASLLLVFYAAITTREGRLAAWVSEFFLESSGNLLLLVFSFISFAGLIEGSHLLVMMCYFVSLVTLWIFLFEYLSGLW